MNFSRRDISLGIAATALGTATAFHTGASIQQTVSREFTVSITDDDGAGVQLPIKPTDSLDTNGRVDIVDNGDVGVLVVDATDLKQDSTVTFGQFDDTDDLETMQTGAITVENQHTTESIIDLEVSLGSGGDSDVELAVKHSDIETVAEGDSTQLSSVLPTNVVEIGIQIQVAGIEEQSVDIILNATRVDDADVEYHYNAETLTLNGESSLNSHTY